MVKAISELVKLTKSSIWIVLCSELWEISSVYVPNTVNRYILLREEIPDDLECLDLMSKVLTIPL